MHTAKMGANNTALSLMVLSEKYFSTSDEVQKALYLTLL